MTSSRHSGGQFGDSLLHGSAFPIGKMPQAARAPAATVSIHRMNSAADVQKPVSNRFGMVARPFIAGRAAT
jgi:hypothetical protein